LATLARRSSLLRPESSRHCDLRVLTLPRQGCLAPG
jgi:hypothetical protein